MKWSNNLRIIGMILSIALFIISLKFNLLGLDESRIDPLTRSVLIFIIANLLSDNIARILAKNEMHQQYEEFRETLNTQIHNQHFGNSEDAMEYVISKLDQIKSIDNTHVKVGGTRSEERIYSSNVYNRFTTALRKAIEQGLVFRDLVGKSSLEYEKKRVIDWAQQKPKSRRVFVKTIDSHIPVINHFILTYHSGKREVLFGWGYNDEKPLEQVFLSRDEKMILYFSNYFENLYRSGESLQEGMVVTVSKKSLP